MRLSIQRFKPAVKRAARSVLSVLPPSESRKHGVPALDGGRPVRDLRLRPWPAEGEGNAARWRHAAVRLLRQVYVDGVEGYPHREITDAAESWAAFCGCSHGLLVAHGTDALRIGLAAALEHDGLSYGGEIIVPNYSFVATMTAALDRRFGIAFVDVDADTLLLDCAAVERAILPGRTRAIMPVHLFGQPADMTALSALARRHGLKLISDAAQAHGSRFAGLPIGAYGDVSAFSFQSSKNLATGEGGALVTNDAGLFERAWSLHDAGRAREGRDRWRHVTLGWNCRVTTYQAVLLTHRFGSFEEQQGRRAANFARLTDLLREVKSVRPVGVHPAVDAHGMYMFALRYDVTACGGVPLSLFLQYVQAEGVPLRQTFDTTLDGQPFVARLMLSAPDYFRKLPTPNADRAALDTAYLPQQVLLGSERDIEDVVSAIAKVERYLGQHRANRG